MLTVRGPMIHQKCLKRWCWKSFDWWATQPIIADGRIIMRYPALFLWSIGMGGDVEEMGWCFSESAAAVSHSGRNLQHDGRHIFAKIDFLRCASRWRAITQIMQRDAQPAKRRIPPIDLCFMDMPGFDHTGIHFGVAELSKSFMKERIGDTDDLFKEASIIRVSYQRMDNDPLNVAKWHGLFSAFLFCWLSRISRHHYSPCPGTHTLRVS